MNLDGVFNKWLHDYRVPEIYYDYWHKAIEIEVDKTLQPPSATWHNPRTGKRHIAVRPEYLNPGVLAHEQAHNSYALLTPDEKREFSAVYGPLKRKDPLIVFLYTINSYGLTSDVEGHAEVYRYIDEKMPEVLKKYYPKLF